MPSPGKRKAPSELTQRQLVGTLVAFTAVVAIIDTIVGLEWARHGLKVMEPIVVVVTLVILALVYRSLYGEMLRRRKASPAPPNDKAP